MLSINLYEMLLSKYSNFIDKDSEYHITKYNIYKSLMELLKSKYNLNNLTDIEFINEMLERNSNSIFDKDIDIKLFKDTYSNYIKYDKEILNNDILNYMEVNYELESYSLDYFKEPIFINAILEIGRGFENPLYGDVWFLSSEDIFCDILEYLSDDIRNNEDFILENITRYPYKFISDELKNNRSFILKLLKYRPSYFRFLEEKFRSDKKLVLKVLEKDKNLSFRNPIEEIVIEVDYSILKYVSDELKNDIEIINAVLDYNVNEYEFLPKKYKNDKKIIERVLKEDSNLAKYLEEDIKNDTKYIEELYFKYDFPIIYTNSEIINKYSNDREVMKKEIYKNVDVINYISEELLNDKKYIINVIEDAESGKSFYNKKLIEKYRDNEEVMGALIKYNSYYISHASNRIKKNFRFNKK